MATECPGEAEYRAMEAIHEKIQAAHDAGIDITAAIAAMDALAGDADLEDDELDGEGISQAVRVRCRCEDEEVMCC